jgi:hypothetical protein
MLGHVLSMKDQIQAKFAMKRFFDPHDNGFLGRPRTTIYTVLANDWKREATNIKALYPQLETPSKLEPLADLE